MTTCVLFTRPLAVIRWHLTDGPKRLQCARLRRLGKTSEAFCLLAGPTVLIDVIRLIPQDLKKRELFIKSVCRKLSYWK